MMILKSYLTTRFCPFEANAHERNKHVDKIFFAKPTNLQNWIPGNTWILLAGRTSQRLFTEGRLSLTAKGANCGKSYCRLPTLKIQHTNTNSGKSRLCQQLTHASLKSSTFIFYVFCWKVTWQFGVCVRAGIPRIVPSRFLNFPSPQQNYCCKPFQNFVKYFNISPEQVFQCLPQLGRWERNIERWQLHLQKEKWWFGALWRLFEVEPLIVVWSIKEATSTITFSRLWPNFNMKFSREKMLKVLLNFNCCH